MEVHDIVRALLGPLQGVLCFCQNQSPRTSLSEITSDSYGEKRELAIDLADQIICLSTCSESLHNLWDGVRKSLIAEEVIHTRTSVEPQSAFNGRRHIEESAPLPSRVYLNVTEIGKDANLTSQRTLLRLISTAQLCLKFSLDIANAKRDAETMQALTLDDALDPILGAVRRGTELLSRILDWARTSIQGRERSSGMTVLGFLQITLI